MTAPTRRTQEERRAATQGKLMDATIDCLVELGYRDTSIGRICERAGVSHGGLFRHFPTRTALIGAATERMVRRHLEHLGQLLQEPDPTRDLVETMVRFFRDSARAPLSAAWREVMVAARTNEELREALVPAVQRFEDSIMHAASVFPGAPSATREFGTLVLSLLHMFESEASTVVVLDTRDVQEIRLQWATELLRNALKP